jgi:hypothetical protein
VLTLARLEDSLLAIYVTKKWLESVASVVDLIRIENLEAATLQ